MHGSTRVSGARPIESFFAWVAALPEEIYPAQLVPTDGRHVDCVAGFLDDPGPEQFVDGLWQPPGPAVGICGAVGKHEVEFIARGFLVRAG